MNNEDLTTYHTILDSNDYYDPDKLFNRIIEEQEIKGDFGITHILIRSMDILDLFPTYGMKHKVTRRTDPTYMELGEDTEGLWEETIEHFHPLSSKLNLIRLVLYFDQELSEDEYREYLCNLTGQLGGSSLWEFIDIDSITTGENK